MRGGQLEFRCTLRQRYTEPQFGRVRFGRIIKRSSWRSDWRDAGREVVVYLNRSRGKGTAKLGPSREHPVMVLDGVLAPRVWADIDASPVVAQQQGMFA